MNITKTVTPDLLIKIIPKEILDDAYPRMSRKDLKAELLEVIQNNKMTAAKYKNINKKNLK